MFFGHLKEGKNTRLPLNWDPVWKGHKRFVTGCDASAMPTIFGRIYHSDATRLFFGPCCINSKNYSHGFFFLPFHESVFSRVFAVAGFHDAGVIAENGFKFGISLFAQFIPVA